MRESPACAKQRLHEEQPKAFNNHGSRNSSHLEFYKVRKALFRAVLHPGQSRAPGTRRWLCVTEQLKWNCDNNPPLHNKGLSSIACLVAPCSVPSDALSIYHPEPPLTAPSVQGEAEPRQAVSSRSVGTESLTWILTGAGCFHGVARQDENKGNDSTLGILVFCFVF